jgi:hypothetical protein
VGCLLPAYLAALRLFAQSVLKELARGGGVANVGPCSTSSRCSRRMRSSPYHLRPSAPAPATAASPRRLARRRPRPHAPRPWWVTLTSRWVALRARWVPLTSRWVTRRARWVTLRARCVTLRARWVTLRARWLTPRWARRGWEPRCWRAWRSGSSTRSLRRPRCSWRCACCRRYEPCPPLCVSSASPSPLCFPLTLRPPPGAPFAPRTCQHLDTSGPLHTQEPHPGAPP